MASPTAIVLVDALYRTLVMRFTLNSAEQMKELKTRVHVWKFKNELLIEIRKGVTKVSREIKGDKKGPYLSFPPLTINTSK